MVEAGRGPQGIFRFGRRAPLPERRPALQNNDNYVNAITSRLVSSRPAHLGIYHTHRGTRDRLGPDQASVARP